MSFKTSPTLVALSCVGLMGCAVPKQILASSDDFADYRAFRLASQEGPRLARAQTYLDRHPRGAWADEVRRTFATEEPGWFERSKASRSLVRDYLVDLPHGPHADAARALLALFDQREADMDTLELLAAWRHTTAALDLQAERRKRVGEVLLEELSALIDPATWRSSLEDPPHSLAAVLRGPAARTWGTAPGGLREDHLFFIVPTRGEAQARVAQVRLRLATEHGRVAQGSIEGEDLFIRWAEATGLRVLDPTSVADRSAAMDHAVEVLSGALEARLPASHCGAKPQGGEIWARACDGWGVWVRMGPRAGSDDVILVRGPQQ